MEYFSTKEAAKRYATGRPDFHAGTVLHIKEHLGIIGKLSKTLDIACGTGLSTKALLTIAGEVYGTDISAEMLNVAHEKDIIHYYIAPAEKQPFPDGKFDLITVSSGVHWFNIDAFLSETNRILKPGAWLVIYENYFTGKMLENESFKSWVDDVYLKNFPSPPRNKHYDWSSENINTKNFSIHVPDEFENGIVFNQQQLINYFTTQSNVIAVVESSQQTYPEVERWLESELQAFFENATRTYTFLFGNRIKYLQKN
jgi:ubiquinone/menaquinone biosynthesis C-methylase UbiE